MPPRVPSSPLPAFEMARRSGEYATSARGVAISNSNNDTRTNNMRPELRQTYSNSSRRPDVEATPRNSISSLDKASYDDEPPPRFVNHPMMMSEKETTHSMLSEGQVSSGGSSMYGGAGHYTEVPDDSPRTRYDKFRKRAEIQQGDDEATLLQRVKQRKAALGQETNRVEGPLSSWKKSLALFGTTSFDRHNGNGNGNDEDCDLDDDLDDSEDDGTAAGRTKGSDSWLSSDTFLARLVRKFLHTVPLLLLLWTPGLIAIFGYDAKSANNYAQPTLLGTGTFWWSVWLSSVWVAKGIMGLLAHWVPRLLRYTASNVSSVNNVTSVLDRQIYYFIATERYVTLFLWTFYAWCSYILLVWANNAQSGSSDSLSPFLPASNSTTTSTSSSSTSILLRRSTSSDSSTSSASTYSSASQDSIQFGRFLMGIATCTIILLAEKLAIQSIAMGFHEVTYQDRIHLAEFHVKVVTTLYMHSRKDLEKLATESTTPPSTKGTSTTNNTTTAFEAIKAKRKRQQTRAQPQRKGTESVLAIASKDLIGPALLAPTSPKAIVTAALESERETKKLARKIFLSYSKPVTCLDKNGGELDEKRGSYAQDGRDEVDEEERVLRVDDVAFLFPNRRYAQLAFSCLDKDANGNCTLEEVEAGFEEMHRERVSLLESMQGVDAAVDKLDKIFTSVYTVVACIIVAALLSTHFATFVTSFGTALLGLSWLVASTAQEALMAVVWVFYKHPIDVGDTVDIPDLLPLSYTTQSLNDTSECLLTATYVVQEIKLLSTVLKSSTGKYVQVSNAMLAQKPLVNLRRSGPIEELVRIKIWYRTSLDDIEELRTEMIKWLESQGRDFKPGLDIQVDGPGDQTGLTLVLGIRYKSNWQNSGIKARRRNRWICTLKNLLWTLKIHGVQGDPMGPSPVQLWSKVDEVPEGALDPAPETREPITKKTNGVAGVKLMDTRKLDETMMDVYGETPVSTWNERIPTVGRTDGRTDGAVAYPTQQQRQQQSQYPMAQTPDGVAVSRPRFPISPSAPSPTSQYIPLHVQGRRMSGRPDESMA